MPEMNGYDATRQIREFIKDVVIIAQTAFAMIGDRENAMEAGCNDYLTKPIYIGLLKGLIEKDALSVFAFFVYLWSSNQPYKPSPPCFPVS